MTTWSWGEVGSWLHLAPLGLKKPQRLGLEEEHLLHFQRTWDLWLPTSVTPMQWGSALF